MNEVSQRLERETGILAGRLAAFLRRVLPRAEESLGSGLTFLEAAFAAVAEGRPPEAWTGGATDRRPPGPPQPLDRLAGGLGLSPLEVDLLLLAGLPEEHEGYADVLRALHPRREPRAAAGLAAQLLCRDGDERGGLRRLLTAGPAVTAGALGRDGDGPLFDQSLRLADGLWPVLHGIDAWPDAIDRRPAAPALAGLEDWLAEPAAARALAALRDFGAVTVLVHAGDEEVARERAAALVASAGARGERVALPPRGDGGAMATLERLIGVHCLARGAVPILSLAARDDGPGVPEVPPFAHHPAPLVVAARDGGARLRGPRPLVSVPCPRLRPSALHRMWSRVLPDLARHAPVLAARYPVEPASARRVAADLAHLETVEGRRPDLADVAACVRGRAGAALGGGVKLLRPAAGWRHLVLADDRLAQLHEAVDRLLHQATVLDDWGFLEGRHGARGVRMLLAGPPGTGKTLSAEVLAHTLEVDLLVVDLSRVVSKWIGETEKNLAEVFASAEGARAVLLFDEADALFGRRTEVSDAHDRYANLETAYLLSRLESFEGLAILSTNLRHNLDPAFLRRLEFIVELAEPDQGQREALWRCHLPAGAPLAADVDLGELAACYPMVGGMIRNAAVAAGFLAATAATAITRDHFLRAIRREYQKSGKAFPGRPGRPSQCPGKEGHRHGRLPASVV